MSLSRRRFLRAGTLVAISAGIPLKSVVAETLRQPGSLLPSSRRNAGSNLNREAFARCLNTKFAFSNKEVEAVNVNLVEVYDLTPKALAATGKECFGVVFKGPNHVLLRQQTYTVTHESLGKFDMLVVPIASRKAGIYYEAIFNRLR